MLERTQAIIDTHAHIVPPSLADEAIGQAPGVTVEDTERGPGFHEGLVHLRPLGGRAELEPYVEWMRSTGPIAENVEASRLPEEEAILICCGLLNGFFLINRR